MGSKSLCVSGEVPGQQRSGRLPDLGYAVVRDAAWPSLELVMGKAGNVRQVPSVLRCLAQLM